MKGYCGNLLKINCTDLTISEEPLDTDLSSHCIKLKAKNPDCVLNWVLPKHGAIILREAAKMGFKPQWMTTSTLSDTPIMYKITKGLYKDVIFSTFAELPGSHMGHSLMNKYKEAHEKFAPKERWGVFFYAGFYFVEPMVEGLKRCGRDLTIENFVDAMESIKDFQGIGPRITFGPDKRQGTRTSFVGQCVEGGKSVRLSEWMTSAIDVKEVIKRAYNR